MYASDLEGRPVSQADNVLFPIPYSIGVKTFAERSKGKIIRGLLTSSIDLVAKRAADELKLDFVLCNVLHRSNGNFKGTLDYNVPTWKKHEKIAEICERYKILPREMCHVGDNENDIKCFEMVGLGIAFDPKTESTRKAAKIVITDFRDLIDILHLL